MESTPLLAGQNYAVQEHHGTELRFPSLQALLHCLRSGQLTSHLPFLGQEVSGPAVLQACKMTSLVQPHVMLRTSIPPMSSLDRN